MNDPRLVDVGVGLIPHENNTVRYWALRVAANPTVWGKLGQDQNAATLSAKIIDACGKVVETSSAECLFLMAQFAGRFDAAPAQDLLTRIADVRIKRYADWAVKYELVDTGILKFLSAKIGSGGPASQQLAKQFGQLYSYAIQRYIRGTKDGSLQESTASQLAAVLVETEQQCLNKLLGGTANRDHAGRGGRRLERPASRARQAPRQLESGGGSAHEVQFHLRIAAGQTHGAFGPARAATQSRRGNKAGRDTTRGDKTAGGRNRRRSHNPARPLGQMPAVQRLQSACVGDST